MNIIVNPTEYLQGKLRLPGSKSHTIRGLFIGLMAKGESTLVQPLISEDISDAIHVCESLGGTIQRTADSLIIGSKGVFNALDCYSGNSGLTTHFVLPLLGLRKNIENTVKVDCGDQMRDRPIGSFLQSLSSLGLTIRSLKDSNKFPIELSQSLNGGIVTVDGETSQYLSSLLQSLPLAKQDSVITVENLQERPYLEMTLQWLNSQSISYLHQQQQNKDIFRIKGNQSYRPFIQKIPGDFSSAANIIAAAVLMNSDVVIENIDMQDTQGDKILISLLQQMGAEIQINDDYLVIKGRRQKLKGITVDAEPFPDLVPILSVIGTQTKDGLHLKNVKHARLKETDRIHSMCEGLMRLGAKIIEYKDGISVFPSHLSGSEVSGYNDHRTVMALTIAGLIAEGTTIISQGEAIQKTFPEFINIMLSLGANIGMSHEVRI